MGSPLKIFGFQRKLRPPTEEGGGVKFVQVHRNTTLFALACPAVRSLILRNHAL